MRPLQQHLILKTQDEEETATKDVTCSFSISPAGFYFYHQNKNPYKDLSLYFHITLIKSS